MSFTSRDGTRGARQPNGRLIRWFNRRLIRRLRRRGGDFFGMQTLVLGTVGRKTHEPRFVPVAWFPAEGDGWIIVASANGAPRNPAWYRNIVANPDQVVVRIGETTTPVDPQELHGDERAAAWKRVISTVPRFRHYAEATDRQLPVIRLTPKQHGMDLPGVA